MLELVGTFRVENLIAMNILSKHVPLIKSLNHTFTVCKQHTEEVGEGCFPNAELKLMHEVGNEH